MSLTSLECQDPAELRAEIARLKGEVARLEERCAELDRLAHEDALVPVANRRGMMRQLETMIARHERYGTPCALLFVDLDGLKVLNDSFGHGAGDAALIHVAELLRAGVRQVDTVARLGGDEFCILLDHADRAAACETASRLVDEVAADDFMLDGKALPLSVAIGITMIEKGDSPRDVMARADQAMYREKMAAA